MSHEVFVELADGSLLGKRFADLNAEDRVVVGGPKENVDLEHMQSALEREIAAAGGLAAWQEYNRVRYT